MGNCEHKVRKGASSKQPLSDSWRLHHICVCCMQEFIIMNKQLIKSGFVEDYYRQSSLCSLANKMELEYNSNPILLKKKVPLGEKRRFNMITNYSSP